MTEVKPSKDELGTQTSPAQLAEQPPADPEATATVNAGAKTTGDKARIYWKPQGYEHGGDWAEIRGTPNCS